MDVLAALGDAPTAAIAIVAILLAVFFAVRGQRGERGAVASAGAADVATPTLLKVPVAAVDPAPDADADAGGLHTMAVGEVGHGAIRLGRPDVQAEPPPATPAERKAAPAPEPEPAPQAEAAPVPDPEPAPTPGTAPFRQGTIKLRDPSGD